VTWSSFVDFIDREDLSLSAFGFKEPSQMVPELRFGDDVVSCEQSQGINFWVGILFGWEFSSHNKELSDLKIEFSLPSFGVKHQLGLDFLCWLISPLI